MAQLHIVEELLELLNQEEPVIIEVHEDSEEELLMCLSKMAVNGTKGPRTVRLVGKIENQEVLILIDLGSSHSFISSKVACLLKRPGTAIKTASVKIANGAMLQCQRQFSDCPWWVQRYTFHTDLRAIDLGCYVVILVMDWLELHSPIVDH